MTWFWKERPSQEICIEYLSGQQCVTGSTLANRGLRKKKGREKIVENEYLMGLPKFAMLEFLFGLPEILRGKRGGGAGTRTREKK